MPSSGTRRDLIWGLVPAVPVGLIALIGTLHVETSPAERPVDALAVVCALAGSGALALWRRAAVVMLVIVGAAMFVYLAFEFPRGPALLPGPVALFLAASTQRRSIAWAAAIGMTVIVVAASVIGRREIDGVAVAALGWPFVAVLAGQLVAARRQQRDSDRVQDELRREHVRESERLRLAQDLHDSVAHAMATITVQSGVAAHLLDRDPDTVDREQLRGALHAIRTAGGEALDELTSILTVLRREDGDGSGGPERRPVGDLTRLDELVDRARSDGLDIVVRRDDVVMASGIAEAAYRVVQEALANTLRHAGPGTRATVTIGREGDDLVVSVADDGGGTPPAPSREGAGLGLVGMRERVEATGGRLTTGRDGRGFRVVARWSVP